MMPVVLEPSPHLRDGGYMLGLAEQPFFAPLTKRLLNREGERL